MFNRGCRALINLGPRWVFSNLADFYVMKSMALLWTRPILKAGVSMMSMQVHKPDILDFRIQIRSRYA